jgi:hypothetical protein
MDGDGKLDLSEQNLIQLLPQLMSAGLMELNVGYNNLTFLPNLPSTLILLECHSNQLLFLPNLPYGLESLVCSNNQLTNLPALPNGIKVFHCDDNQLNNLPKLPDALTEFACQNNQLTALPKLPINLEFLECQNNQLTALPEIPINLEFLECQNNQLTALPEIPSSLYRLNCNTNKLLVIPPLKMLRELDCGNNQLSNIPSSNLIKLICNNNKLTNFPINFPNTIRYLDCRNNLLTIIPHLNNVAPLAFADCRENRISGFRRGTRMPIGIHLPSHISLIDIVDIKIDVNNLSLNSLIRYKNYLMLGVGAYTDAINERKQTLREVEERGYVENFKLVSGKHGEIQTSTGVIQSQHTNLIKSFITGAIGGTKKNAQNRRKKWTHHKRK